MTDEEDYYDPIKALRDIVPLVKSNHGDDPALLLGVLIEAYEIYLDRGHKYGQLWRVYGWSGNVLHIMSKAARIKKMFWGVDYSDRPQDIDSDDVYDIINYAAFVIQDMKDGNQYGR